ncbi:MAG: hypothetical protein IKX35_01950 [Bacteroidales bacterium]|nr:hypothetical protein [Bacteroidales bacterium]
MKKTLVLVLLALVMTGCWRAKPKAEPKQSAAKESVWDFYLIGTWQYNEDDSDIKSSFPQGTESFYGDGKYLCHAIDKKGKNVTVEGVWRLDDNEDFVVWVTINAVKSGGKTLSKEKKKVKYVVNALAPNKYIVYQVGDAYRTAEWVE